MLIEKPWGIEKILEINENYMLKSIVMNEGQRCSLQYHNKKCETIYVLSGKLRITTGKNINLLKAKVYKKGKSLTINPNIIHRMEALIKSVYLEISTPHTDDVIRILDDYNRVK